MKYWSTRDCRCRQKRLASVLAITAVLQTLASATKRRTFILYRLYYIGAAQFEYWQHTQLIIDVVPGRGSGFSAEAPEGVRFLTRSRVFTDEEVTALEAAGPRPVPHKARAAQRVNRTLQNYGVAARLQTRSISISALYASPVTPTQVRAGSRSTGK
jgi:hypothetical protein